MNSKQRATLAAIFENPVRTNIRWADIESLLRALRADRYDVVILREMLRMRG